MEQPAGLLPALLRAPGRGSRCTSRCPLQAAARHLRRHVRQLAVRAALPPQGAWQQQQQQLPSQPAPLTAVQAALRGAAALLAALLLHLGDGGAGGGGSVAQASVAEDRLLEFVRQVEVKVDSAVEAVKDVASQVRVTGAGKHEPRPFALPRPSCHPSAGTHPGGPSPPHPSPLALPCRAPRRAPMRLQGGIWWRRCARWWRPTLRMLATRGTAARRGWSSRNACWRARCATAQQHTSAWERGPASRGRRHPLLHGLLNAAGRPGCVSPRAAAPPSPRRRAAPWRRAPLPHVPPPPPPLAPSGRSAIRELLAQLRDPYTRFVPAADFAAMRTYDVSGVGLNLGTAEEFANKTVGGWVGGCGAMCGCGWVW